MTREEQTKGLRSYNENKETIEDPAVSSVYLELGGNAIAYSVNYDRMYDNKYVLRAGIGYFTIDNAGIATIPLTGSYVFGRGASKFEIGLGATILTAGSISEDSILLLQLSVQAFLPIVTIQKTVEFLSEQVLRRFLIVIALFLGPDLLLVFLSNSFFSAHVHTAILSY